MDLREFMDFDYPQGYYSYGGYNQTFYSSMIYPVICWASVPRTVTVQLSRNVSGNRVWLGRPIVLPGGCSWFIDQ